MPINWDDWAEIDADPDPYYEPERVQFQIIAEPPPPPVPATHRRCEQCYNRRPVDTFEAISGHTLCQDCTARHTQECTRCHIRAFDTYYTTAGRDHRVCRDCARLLPSCTRCSGYHTTPEPLIDCCDFRRVCPRCVNEAQSCSECGGLTLDGYTTTEDATVCRPCRNRMTMCRCCSRYASPGALIADQYGHGVCSVCLDEQYTQCVTCEEWRHRGQRCEECNPRYDEHDGDLIQSYNFKPRPLFQGDGPTYLGLELEVARANYRCAEIAIDALGEVGYLKHDSSINNGFEIVTHPMSHAFTRESFPWEMLEALSEAGARADNSTGIHVHVSRKAFDSAAHAYRWMKLIYRNEDGVTRIARRSSEEWGRFDEDERKAVKRYAKDKRGSSGRRYSAINVQNRATFEVRVFRSSLNRREVQAALDLVAASVEYTRSLTVPQIVAGGWDWDSFVDWVDTRDEYTALGQEMHA